MFPATDGQEREHSARAAVAVLSVPRLPIKKEGKNRYAASQAAPSARAGGAPRPVVLTASDVRKPT